MEDFGTIVAELNKAVFDVSHTYKFPLGQLNAYIRRMDAAKGTATPAQLALLRALKENPILRGTNPRPSPGNVFSALNDLNDALEAALPKKGRQATLRKILASEGLL